MSDQPREPDKRELAARRLPLLDAYLAAAERRGEIIRIAGESIDREHARSAVAQLLGVDENVADGVLELRILRFTKDEMELVRAEREYLRTILGR